MFSLLDNVSSTLRPRDFIPNRPSMFADCDLRSGVLGKIRLPRWPIYALCSSLWPRRPFRCSAPSTEAVILFTAKCLDSSQGCSLPMHMSFDYESQGRGHPTSQHNPSSSLRAKVTTSSGLLTPAWRTSSVEDLDQFVARSGSKLRVTGLEFMLIAVLD